MPSLSRAALLAVLSLAASISLSGCTSDSSIGGTDTVSNNECSPGQTRQAADGCTTCACQPDRTWTCTAKACPTPPTGCPAGTDCPPTTGCPGGADCPTTGCQTSDDCPHPLDTCAVSTCVAGQCQTVPQPGCQSTCTSDSDCSTSADVCHPNLCQAGQCAVVTSDAAGCSAKCASNDDCPASTDACQKSTCQAGACVGVPSLEPSCAGACASDADCPTGLDVCHTWSCQSGKCAWGPSGAPVCEGKCVADADCPASVSVCTQNVCEAGKCVPQDSEAPGCEKNCSAQVQCPQAADYCHPNACLGGYCTVVLQVACASQCALDTDCPESTDSCHQRRCQAGKCIQSFSPGPTCQVGCVPGQIVDAGDDCNTCTCQDSGLFACTKLDCTDECAQCEAQLPASCQKAICTGGVCKYECADTGCKADTDCEQTCITCNGLTSCAPGVCEAGACAKSAPPECQSSAFPGNVCDKQGATSASIDGCNTCKCKGGRWACTHDDCGAVCTTSDDCPYSTSSCFENECEGGRCHGVAGTSCGCEIDTDCASPPTSCLDCEGINHCAQSRCGGDTCVAMKPSCGDSCAPQDAHAVGPMTSYLGEAWDGTKCVELQGDSCAGADCDKLYKPQGVCGAIHQSCSKAP